MSIFQLAPIRSVRSFKYGRYRPWPVLILGILVLPGFVIAGGNPVASCALLVDKPALYDECLQNRAQSMIDIESVETPVKDSEETCSCDIRKQKQVERRIQKQQQQEENSDSGSDAPID